MLTLRPADGAQLGATVTATVPPYVCQFNGSRQMLYAEHVLPGALVILGDRLELVILSITIDISGTPVFGSWDCATPTLDAQAEGAGRSLAEMAGAAFDDGIPRLCVGTDSGRILLFVPGPGGGLEFERSMAVATAPINSLAPIPMYGGIPLGVATGNTLQGILDLNAYPVTLFSLQHPREVPIWSFRVFNRDDSRVTLPGSPVEFAFCDGRTSRIHYGTVPSTTAGSQLIDTVYTPSLIAAATDGNTGSLLLLTAGGSEVLYRPGYLDGSSVPGCVVHLEDSDVTPCAPCAIELTGDVNRSGTYNAADVMILVNYIFKGGYPPEPCDAAGDVDCSGSLSAVDVIHLVNYVFKGGSPPCNVCSLFAGTWTCP
jgi:hypothetical protein